MQIADEKEYETSRKRLDELMMADLAEPSEVNELRELLTAIVAWEAKMKRDVSDRR